MVRIEIAKSLFEDIERKFKREASKIFDFMETLKESPHKGKTLGNVGAITIKELKYKGFRLYFLADGFKLKFLDEEKLIGLLIKFVRMSEKNNQQKVIDEIRHVLQTIGPEGFV